jgi:hypothetical protein
VIKAQTAQVAESNTGGQYPTNSTSAPTDSPKASDGLSRLGAWLRQSLSWRHRRALAGHAADMDDCAKALGSHAAATEPEFLALGGDLRTLYELATALAQAVDEATTRLHADLSANRIAGSDGAVAQALQSVDGSIASIDNMLARLRTITDGLLSMKPQMDRIGRVGVLLQSVAVGFAVESSRTKECQQAFGSFVDEIRGLSRRTREIENRISEELDLASSKEIAALRLLEQELTSLRELSRQLELTSSRTATEVQDRLNDIVAAMAAMRKCSQLIQHHTEDAVFHMQFGDIVRQKIEHTVDAIHESAAELTRTQSPVQSAATAHRTLAVQIGQLEMVGTELATAQRQLGQAFSKISESSASLVAPSPQMAKSDRGGTVELKTLLEDLAQLQQLVAQGSQLRLRAGESGSEAFATAKRIASQIREVQSVNREMHLLALNAIVKTAALGATGATLGVLSMQVHALYLEADAAVREIDALAQQLTGAQQQGEVAAGEHSGSYLLEILEQVRRAANDYQITTDSLGEKVVRNREQLDKATARLETLDAFSHQLNSLRGRLGTVSTALSRRFGQSLTQARYMDTPTDDARYTMQSERDVHQRIGGPLASATTPVPSVASVRTVQTEAYAAEPAKGVTAEADTPRASSPTPPPSTESPSLGDNVELF